MQNAKEVSFFTHKTPGQMTGHPGIVALCVDEALCIDEGRQMGQSGGRHQRASGKGTSPLHRRRKGRGSRRSHLLYLTWRSVVAFIRRESIDRIVIILGILITISVVVISQVESISLVDSFWWSIVTLTTVGYGDISPATMIGRFIAMVNMFVGIGLLAALSAALASVLIERKRKEELGMSDCRFQDHVILCEWNHRAANIVQELRMDQGADPVQIALIAQCDRKPIDDPNLAFISGPVSDATLKRANLAEAKNVIILGNDQLDASIRDATVVLSTLTVESLNSHVYTIVELVDHANAITCYRANADEVIISSELSSMLISQAALNHGISKVISELLSVQTGNQLYKVPLPPVSAGHTFLEAFTHMKQQYQSTVVALQKGFEGEVISNPENDHIVDARDYLIVISHEAPQTLRPAV